MYTLDVFTIVPGKTGAKLVKEHGRFAQRKLTVHRSPRPFSDTERRTAVRASIDEHRADLAELGVPSTVTIMVAEVVKGGSYVNPPKIGDRLVLR